ncbi:MAG: AAA family ATPase [Fibrobacter sp.]|nr:AAA family ATPase [Fibrobacter sp.]
MTKYCLQGPESQKGARQLLENALVENRFPQAVLIEGERGIGKKALAIELSKTLCCTDSEIAPCGHCFGCKLAMDPGNVQGWVIPLETAEANAKSASSVSENSKAKTVEDYKAGYVAEIFKNPYSTSIISSVAQISVDQIRGMMSQFSRASEGVRVVIIAEADRMNEAAANALLKTLEEVPTNTYFILTSSVAGRLLQTIRSRCLSLRLPPLTNAEVEEIVKNTTGETLSPDALGMSLGSPGMAMYYNENIAENETIAFEFLKDSVEGNYSDLFFELDKTFPRGTAAADAAVMMLDFLAFMVNDALRLLANEPVRLTDRRESLEQLNLGRFGAEALEKAILDINSTAAKIAGRKNSAIVALQTLSIGLFEGYKR